MRLAQMTVMLTVCAVACTSSQAADRAQDIEVYSEQFLAVDASYSEEARGEAQAKLSVLREDAGGMTDAQFELALAEIAALADNGHTMLLPARWATTFNRLAVRFLIADDGLFVADAASGYEALIGTRVTAIDGHDLDALRAVWSRYHSGLEGFRDNAMYLFIESPELLHAAGVAKAPDMVELAFADGASERIGASDHWPAPEGIWSILPQARTLELAAAGRIEGDPIYLQDAGAFFRLVELPDRDAVYIQYRANVDFTGAIDLGVTSGQAIETLRSLSPRYVVVDQRFNLGGDLNNSRALMQAIPEIVGEEGRVVAITSGRTFSAGISSLGYLKQAGGERVTMVGAPVGDRLEFWAEGEPVELPNSSALILVATERHNYEDGCPEDDCHESIRLNPITVETLAPDYTPRFTYADVIAGRDPYLDASLALIGAATTR